MRIHDRRTRKTGPKHPLIVMRCKTHNRSYTLYPPGYIPYQRQPIIPQADTQRTSLSRWKETIWAFLIVIVIECTTRLQAGETAWRLYRRHMATCAQWLGLDTGSPNEEMAHVLGLHLHTYNQAHKDYQAAKTLPQRCRALWPLFAYLHTKPHFFQKLLTAGMVTGTLGQAWLWKTKGGFQVLFPPKERAPP